VYPDLQQLYESTILHSFQQSKLCSNHSGHSVGERTMILDTVSGKEQSIWRSWDRASLVYSFKYNQQDATFYNILYYVNTLHVSGSFSAHHRELKNCTHSIRYTPSLLAASASVGELFQLTHTSGRSKQAWRIPDVICTVFERLMMGTETTW